MVYKNFHSLEERYEFLIIKQVDYLIFCSSKFLLFLETCCFSTIVQITVKKQDCKQLILF